MPRVLVNNQLSVKIVVQVQPKQKATSADGLAMPETQARAKQKQQKEDAGPADALSKRQKMLDEPVRLTAVPESASAKPKAVAKSSKKPKWRKLAIQHLQVVCLSRHLHLQLQLGMAFALPNKAME